MSDGVPTVVDLFAGAGGFSLGFAQAGFRVLGAVECDPIPGATYARNHPTTRLLASDIRQVDPGQIANEPITCVIASPPCQPFSKITRGGDIGQRYLPLECVRVVEAVRPVYLVVENVPGFRRDQEVFETFAGRLRRCGYVVRSSVLNAADYGVPQRRLRLFIIAAQFSWPVHFPAPSHAEPEMARFYSLLPWVTVRQAFDGLAVLNAGEASETDRLHRARRHRSAVLERLRSLPKDGGGRHSLPAHLVLQCHRHTKGFKDSYGRLRWNQPAPTLTTHCTTPGCGRYTHPDLDRGLTLREAARLQSFPDWYEFAGRYDQIAVQIGNAVPPRLAEAVATQLLECYRRHNAR